MADILCGQEEVLDVPANALKAKPCFSFDIGGSLIKLVYTLGPQDGKIRIHFVSYPRSSLDRAVALIQKKFDGRIAADLEVISCGVGSNEFKHILQKELHIRISNQSEMDCTVKAYVFLTKNLPLERIIYEPSAKVNSYVQSRLAAIKDVYGSGMGCQHHNKNEAAANGESNETNQSAPEKSGHTPMTTPETSLGIPNDNNTGDDSNWPVLLFVLGSASSVTKVNADGKYSMVDALPRGGRTLVGLGSILIGTKSFEELMELAAKGDADNLDVLGKHMKASEEDVPWGEADNLVMYSLGQAAGKCRGDFRREDIAAGLVSYMAQSLVNNQFLQATFHNTARVFFGGSLVGLSKMFREELDKFYSLRSRAHPMRTSTKHYFLKFGGYLGGLGAMLMSLQKN